MNQPTKQLSFRKFLAWAQLLVMVLVAIGLVWAIFQAAKQLAQQPLAWRDFHWWKLGLAIPVSATAVLLGGVMWRVTLSQMGITAGWNLALRAYSASQLGKYVPGKAMVLVVRVAVLQLRAAGMAIGVASCFVETLFWLLVGAEWACVALLVFFPQESLLVALTAACVLLAGFVGSPPILSWLTSRAAGRLPGGWLSPTAPSFSWSYFFVMHVGFSVAWLLQAGGMWLVMSAVAPGDLTRLDIALALAAVTTATIVGFLSMLPGGLGARELVFIPLLATRFTLPHALTIAIFVRLISITGELVLTAIMVFWKRWKPSTTLSDSDS